MYQKRKGNIKHGENNIIHHQRQQFLSSIITQSEFSSIINGTDTWNKPVSTEKLSEVNMGRAGGARISNTNYSW